MDTELAVLQQRIGNLLRDAEVATQTVPERNEINGMDEVERLLTQKARAAGTGLRAFIDD